MKADEKLEIAMRAKVGLCWVQSLEEVRVERAVQQIARNMEYQTVIWTVTQGMYDPTGELEINSENTKDPAVALDALLNMDGRIVCLFVDFAAWLNDPITMRTARDVHRKLTTLTKEQAKQAIMLDVAPPPEGLVGVNLVEWPMPDRDTMDSVLNSFLEWIPEKAQKDVKKNGNRDKLLSAMLGLTTEGAATALSASLATKGLLNPDLVAKEKERVVRGSGLEWYEPDPRGMEAVGGLEVLKSWLDDRRQGFGSKAREYGLPSPRGVLLLGVPGSGKSLVSKCIASNWNLPLLRMDVGNLFSKYVGESEGKIRRALQTAEAVSPCILWIDEVEKAFAGTSGGESDGGTTARVFGTFLTWMQERKDGIFIIATSNNIQQLPPEFCRAGRWDDIWFVDLPTKTERASITDVMKAKFQHCDSVDSVMVAAASEGYTGAEIEQGFGEALFTAFSQKARNVLTKDVTGAIKSRVPLSKTMDSKLQALQKWAEGRARMASKIDKETKNSKRSIE